MTPYGIVPRLGGMSVMHEAGRADAVAGAAGIAWSLTGQELRPDDELASTDAAQIVAWLARHGWSCGRLEQRARLMREAGQRWPAPVSAERREGLGAAQFQARTRQVLLELGLDHARPVLRDASTPMDAADRRLVAELPPHHGRVG